MLLPTRSSDFFMSYNFPYANRFNVQDVLRPELMFYLKGTNQPLLTIADLPGFRVLEDGWNDEQLVGLPPEMRFHLFPDQQLLIIAPPPDDLLILKAGRRARRARGVRAKLLLRHFSATESRSARCRHVLPDSGPIESWRRSISA